MNITTCAFIFLLLFSFFLLPVVVTVDQMQLQCPHPHPHPHHMPQLISYAENIVHPTPRVPKIIILKKSHVTLSERESKALLLTRIRKGGGCRLADAVRELVDGVIIIQIRQDTKERGKDETNLMCVLESR
jgi:hypothetical protein